jgi:asparagine synthase (glutamine-hydrolysing)
MGALWLLVYTNSTPEPITSDFFKHFLLTSNRGSQYTDIVTKSSVDIYKNESIKRQAKQVLSRHNFLRYSRHHVLHGFHRMSITDASLNAIQPFQDSSETTVLMCNGELYNYQSLVSNYSLTGLSSTSDVEVLIPLYKHFTSDLFSDMLNTLHGEFSLVVTENVETFQLSSLQMFAATDLLGTKSMYLLYNTTLQLYMVFSELKNVPMHILKNTDYTILQFPPASFWSYQNDPTTFVEYYDFTPFCSLEQLTYITATPDSLSSLYQEIVEVFTSSVVEKFSFGSNGYSSFLLSGGFDSSLILSIIVKSLSDNNQLDLLDNAHVFTVSDCELSADTISAIQLIEFLNDTYDLTLNHHIVYISNTELIASKLDDIVYITETYDSDIVVDSVFYYFLYTHIKNNKDTLGNFNSILTGDGLDEYCGYDSLVDLDNQQFQEKSIELLKHMHATDLLKTDKISGFFGFEARYPFLDKNVMNLLLNIHPSLKKKISFNVTQLPVEKYIIRKAFDTGEYMPSSNLWRSHSPISNCLADIKSSLETHYNNVYTLDEFNDFLTGLPDNLQCIPQTRLDMHLYKLFVKHFSSRTSIVQKRHSPLA